MPHRGGIKMAYRERSVIKRPQKIGFYVYNACRCLSEGIQHIRYMLKLQLSEPVLHLSGRQVISADSDCRSGAVQNITDKL